VAKSYGMYLDDKGMTKRGTVVIDRNGKVVWIKEQPLGEARNNKEVLEALQKA
jgi:alkyl hydroperoxide reductase subunit AhpC